MDENKTFAYVDCPPGVEPIGVRWVTSIKGNGIYKARLVCQGFRQIEGINYTETFAPVIRYESVRILLALSARKGFMVHHLDVKTTFLNADLEDEVYIKQPEGFDKGNKKVLRLLKSLYGLKQAPHMWNLEINKTVIKLGFRRCDAEHGLYALRDKRGEALLGLYVDDMLLSTSSPELMRLIKEELMSTYKMSGLGPVKLFLGLDVAQHTDMSIEIGLSSFIKKVLTEFKMEGCAADKIPMSPDCNLSKDIGESRPCDATFYRSIVGKLLFASNVLRYDISFAVGVLSRYLKEPTELQLSGAKKVLRYLKGTDDFKLVYRFSDKHESELVGYTDADYANDVKTRKSVTGYMFRYNNEAIYWRSSLQRVVAISTCEYMAITEGTKEGLWLSQVLSFMDENASKSCRIYSDNQGALTLVKHPMFHHRTKHIDIRLMFVRDHVQSKRLTLDYVSTELQIADLLTKPLSGTVFERLKAFVRT